MSNEQKLREALQAFENGGTGFDICPTRRLPQSEDARRVDEWWLRYFMEADLSVRVRARQALATTEPTSKQSLQVEPAVNQQLTTEPVADLSDDMGSLADYFGDMAQQKADLDASRGVSMPVSYYASTVVAAALAWQARAAMAKGVKG